MILLPNSGLPDTCEITVLFLFHAKAKNGQVVKYARGKCNVCGSIKDFYFSALKNGNTKSCCRPTNKTALGLSKHPLYKIWHGMNARCSDKVGDRYRKNYHDKGIQVCDEWKDFLSFYNWAIVNGWQQGLEIDREENTGNYEPNNCRFVTRLVNGNNRSVTRYLTFQGETKLMSEWAKVLGLCYKRVHKRYKDGRPIEQILSNAPLKQFKL